jgi:hypothetical protein
LVVGCVVAVPAIGAPPPGAVEPGAGGPVDLLMYAEPELPVPEAEQQLDEASAALWVEGLGQPDVRTRVQAAAELGEAAAAGFELPAGAVQALAEAAAAEDPRVAAAAAGTLASLGRDGDLDAIAAYAQRADAEPETLRRVDHVAALEGVAATQVWLDRLTNRSLGVPNRESAAWALRYRLDESPRVTEALRAVVEDGEAPLPLRLEAASSLASGGGLIDLARRFASDGVSGGLLAVRLLAEGHGEPARQLLHRLMREADRPDVAAAAARVLARIDPGFLEHAEVAAGLERSSGRLALARAAQQRFVPDAASARAAGLLLGDPSPEVRRSARVAFFGEPTEPEVRGMIAEALAGDDWRALEQAALATVPLAMADQNARLVELLEHDRAEVRLAAAWALRTLADEASMQAALRRLETLTDVLLRSVEAAIEDPDAFAAASHEATQLAMLMGLPRHEPADELLRRYIPKRSGAPADTRAAAVWALGLIHEGQADGGLVRSLQQRLSDVNPMEPEADQVRRMAAIALGRMDAQGAAGVLRRFYGSDDSTPELKAACAWAFEQITGESLPPLEVPAGTTGPHFLESIE